MLNKCAKPILLMVLTLLVGCGTARQDLTNVLAEPPTHGDALVYIFRTDTLPKAHSAAFYISGKKIGDLSRNEFTYIYLKPGKYTVTAAWPADSGLPNQEIVLYAIAGKTDYIRLAGSLKSLSPAPGEFDFKTFSFFEVITEDIAHPDLENCTYVQPLIARLDS